MGLFDVNRIKWYKYMENTIENVKLSNVVFEDGSAVRFDFLIARKIKRVTIFFMLFEIIM